MRTREKDRKGSKNEPKGRPEGRRTAVIAVLLALLAALPYLQTFGHDFIDYDDNAFVTANPDVQAGLTGEGVRWALTAAPSANWMPVTWLSHMLDVSLFGMAPGWHHLVNAVIHGLSTALLFLALLRMTGSVWRSAFVAALFGIHPLHVESVAWVAERKDVLSGLFFMLVLLAYERYTRRGGAGRYSAVLLLFALGLMSKSMLVTVPFVLLLLDAWPLGRTSLAAPADGSQGKPVPWLRLVLEKAPFFALTLAVSVITYTVQREGGAMGAMERELLPLGTRLANAVVAYADYLGKTLWPASLAIFYPHPGVALPWWKIAAASVFLAAVTLLAIVLRRHRPYLLAGWCWYIGMLVPVIGLVQVGIQAQADRYTYLPLIGPFIMVAWGVEGAVPRTWPARGRALTSAACAVLLVLLVVTALQVRHWSDTIAVFRRAVDVVPDNWLAHRLLAGALAKDGRPREAVIHYREALRIRPRDAKAHNDLAVELAGLGLFDEAIEHYREALRILPQFPEAHNNLGNALALTGRRTEAAEQYRQALALRPGWSIPLGNLQQLMAGEAAAGARR